MLFIIALAAFVLATLVTGQCNNNTGSLECCKIVEPASSPTASQLLVLLGIVVQNGNEQVGLTCSPISIVGNGGNSCTGEPVCCTNNTFSGVVALNCTPPAQHTVYAQAICSSDSCLSLEPSKESFLKKVKASEIALENLQSFLNSKSDST